MCVWALQESAGWLGFGSLLDQAPGGVFILAGYPSPSIVLGFMKARPKTIPQVWLVL